MWKRQHPRTSFHNLQLWRLFQRRRAINGNLGTERTERTGQIIPQAVFLRPRQGCNHGAFVDGRGRCKSTPGRLRESQFHIGFLTKESTFLIVEEPAAARCSPQMREGCLLLFCVTALCAPQHFRYANGQALQLMWPVDASTGTFATLAVFLLFAFNARESATWAVPCKIVPALGAADAGRANQQSA
jgi:hypothetical protein